MRVCVIACCIVVCVVVDIRCVHSMRDHVADWDELLCGDHVGRRHSETLASLLCSSSCLFVVRLSCRVSFVLSLLCAFTVSLCPSSTAYTLRCVVVYPCRCAFRSAHTVVLLSSIDGILCLHSGFDIPVARISRASVTLLFSASCVGVCSGQTLICPRPPLFRLLLQLQRDHRSA